MALEWVNHASYVLESGRVRLVTDPWLVGRAFDNGWAHLSPSVHKPDDLASMTHIWISHEHPDHFSPPTLRGIPEDKRPGITVLYQDTADHKVAEYCRAQGFTVREMADGRWLGLGDGVEAACATWPGGDSYLAVRAGGQTFLNLNDCVITNEAEARQAARRVGLEQVDVLFTQFSYANWVGNPEDRDLRRAEASEKLERIAGQVHALHPTFVVPFASFVWFCHEENSWANDEAVTVARAAEMLGSRTSAHPVVLYPGERWVVGDAHANGPSIERYEEDRRRVLDGPLVAAADPVPIDELQSLAADFWAKLEDVNGRTVLRALERSKVFGVARVWLTDHGRAYRFGPSGGLLPDEATRAGCDVALSSNALAFCLRQLYGGSTLLVNGRFQVPAGGSFARFSRWLRLANLNNRGRSVLGAVPEIADRIGLRAERGVAALRQGRRWRPNPQP